MGLVRTLKSAVDRLRTDPYHYECAVCDRTFETDRSACPDCGGDVERVAGGFDSTAVDPHP